MLVSMWFPGHHVVSTFEITGCLYLKSHGVHMETMEITQRQQENHEICSFQANFKPQLRQHMETMWFPPGNDIVPTRGNDVVSILWCLTVEMTFPSMEIMCKLHK